MKLHHFEHPQQYYERVKSYLLQHEADHSLILGISNTLICSPERFTEQSYLVAVEEDDTVLAAAIRTPPRKLVLSRSLNSKAIRAIAQDLYSHSEPLPGVIAPSAEAKTFTEMWQTLTAQSYRIFMAQRIYQLETVQPIPKANGYLRHATQSDRKLLVSWYKAFTQEALGDDAVEQDDQHLVDRRLSEGNLYLWQDKVPVSMAGFSGATPNGIRINLVYTPPQYRRKGYATSCVAALSQTLLDEGRKYCFLFTDLANPTSNHIYQTIGYQPVCDINDYWFTNRAI
jgi:predicted GNAT family acetyltransferase